MLSVTNVKGSPLLTLCVLLQGSNSIESEKQLALVLYNPNNRSSTTETLFTVIVINSIKYSQVITIPQI